MKIKPRLLQYYYQTVSTFLFNKKIISDKMLIHTRMGAFSMNFFSFASEKEQEIIP